MSNELTPAEAAYRAAQVSYSAALRDNTHVEEARHLYLVAVNGLGNEQGQRRGMAS